MTFFNTFRALGTEVSLWLLEVPERSSKEDFVSVKEMIMRFEARFTRFSPESELSRFNAAEGPFEASEEMRTLLHMSLDLHRETDGVFDPSIHDALVSSGYDRSFDRIVSEAEGEDGREQPHALEDMSRPKERFSDITIEGTVVTKPKGLHIDFGGIGKGYIIDRVADFLEGCGYRDFWVSAGGDMVISGNTENGEPHSIGVQNPTNLKHDLFDLQPNCGRCAIATSGIAKRAWTHHGEHKHHLINPFTMRSADSDLLAVTVLARDALHADVYAKTAFILGRERGRYFIDTHKDVESVSIDVQCNSTFSKNMRKYIHTDHAHTVS